MCVCVCVFEFHDYLCVCVVCGRYKKHLVVFLQKCSDRFFVKSCVLKFAIGESSCMIFIVMSFPDCNPRLAVFDLSSLLWSSFVVIWFVSLIVDCAREVVFRF